MNSIPIKIQDKVVGVINIDEKVFMDMCGEAGMEALKGAGNLLAIAVKSAGLEKEIMSLSSVQSDFVSSFPHELRTPIAVIKDTVSMLQEGVMGQINENQKKALELTSKNVERLWRLSEELLELSAIAAVKTPMKRKLTDITEGLVRAISKHHPAAKEKSIKVGSNLEGKKIEIWVDEEKLTIAVSHLIDNAVKYTGCGGKVNIHIEDANECVRICVSDTGAGICQNDLGRVMDKFYRVTMRASGEGKKWGIGLPIVKEIVDMHCGTVTIESEVGKGSAFTIALPKNLRP